MIKLTQESNKREKERMEKILGPIVGIGIGPNGEIYSSDNKEGKMTEYKDVGEYFNRQKSSSSRP